MAFCVHCGAEVQSNFCPKCGAKQGVPSAASVQLNENIACAACYLLWVITGVLFLVLEPYSRSRLVKFHALQSIFTGVALYAGVLVLRMLTFLPFVIVPLLLLLQLFGFGLWLLLMYKAYRRERWELPVIGALASSLAAK